MYLKQIARMKVIAVRRLLVAMVNVADVKARLKTNKFCNSDPLRFVRNIRIMKIIAKF